MIEEHARVVRVYGDIAEITTERQSACTGCAAKGGCGTSLLTAWFPRRRLIFHVKNDIGARSGDAVVVGLDESLMQRGSLLLYALPLAGLLSGAMLGEHLFAQLGLSAELGAVVSGLLGLMAALLVVQRVTRGRQLGGEQGVRLLRLARPSISRVAESIISAQQQQGIRKYE